MMLGAVNDDLEATLRVTVCNESGASCDVDAVIDTGFNGHLTLTKALIEQLNCTWLYREPGELADGSIGIFDVYAVTVIWDGAPRLVNAEMAEVQPLIGMRLLERCELCVHALPGGAAEIRGLD